MREQTQAAQHRSSGVGAETRVYCPEDAEWFGPHPDASFDVDFCPYCGADATDEDHRVDGVIGEVFCENTIMSTWRYCPSCGEQVSTE